MMTTLKRTLIIAALAVGLSAPAASSADGAVYVRRFAPVRRVAARAVLPPYPVARRAAYGPIYRPIYGPAFGGFYGPRFYGPGVYVGIGF